ncbi:P-loop containing nucleoside triphosphate hydrolase protein [Gorgonomyces haynaldii]|nr:P-loop containing nucleoside triphosphate hydrolase protein [Gorgonomyces haynaldii]
MADKLEIYTKGTKAWFKDAHEGYVTGTLVSKTVDDSKVVLKFTLDSNGQEELFESTPQKLEKNNYDDLPLLKNPPHLEGADDLTSLSYLHEAAVLNSVKIRYQQHIIYTYSGLVLIAMNPFARLNIYSREQMREYAGRPRHELEPHLFAIAEEAYRKMIDEKQNQSIIVSGESGAGKTQSAKYVMRYFATVDELSSLSRRGSTTEPGGGVSKIEDAVLSTNPIMEAFGNSKTTRNDNSSRFGKYIEILFNPKTDGTPGVEITGARMRTYLLERSRLVFQPKSERNYHIFYQLCAAAPAAEKAELGLGAWNTFHYLRQGETGVVQGMDDVEEFAATQKAFSVVGVSVSSQWDIFKVCAALLHLGNIQIKDVRGNAHIEDDDPALLIACKLLGIESAQLKKWFVKRQITMRSESIIKDATVYQAVVGRDSVAKFIYSMLFDWLVKIVNQKLDPNTDAKDTRFIGVLDIYGFEHFEKNSFEQFCINYANEKLQQEFTRHVFKLEQEEYVAEQINWSFIDFNDNGPCIDMIENKLGILDLLDEESRLPSGSDENLVTKLYNRFATPQHKFFDKPRFGQKEFIIKHYALDVTYQIDGFIEKNKDTVSEEQLATLNDSSFEFLKEVIKIEEPETKSSPPAGRGGPSKPPKKPTLGSIFKGSLIKLMETLRETNPHYIRCIKPNQAKVAFEYEAQNVLAQLVACGVLETIKISRAGYPSKQTFDEFVGRYYFLVPSETWNQDAKALTKQIVEKCIKGEDKFQIGIRKIFFRAGQLAYLEKLRSEKFTAIITFIQKNARRAYYAKKYRKMRTAAVKIQSLWRGKSARLKYKKMRQEAAALVIQKNLKAAVARKKFKKTLRAIVVIQRAWRRYIRKRDFEYLQRRDAAVKIQSVWRMYKAKKAYKLTRRRVILIQSCMRRRKAKKEFKILRAEARSVGNLKKVQGKLEQKIVELSQRLNAMNKDNADTHEKMASYEAQVQSWKEKYSKLESESKAKTNFNEEEVHDLRKQVAALLEAKDSLTKEQEKATAMVRKRDDQLANLTQENNALKEEIKRLKDEAKNAPKVEDLVTINALKKEVASLREQMSRVVAGKYQTDKATEQFLSGSTAPASTAARMGLSFFESAAQVTAQVAESLTIRVAGSASQSAENLNVRSPRVEEEHVEQKDRPIRMLESKELEDEILESLVTTLRIPLPSTQTVATRKEIFFPAHLIGYLVSQLAEYQMIDRIRDLTLHVMQSIRHLTMKFEDDYVSAFWLSNAFEMISVIKTIRDKLSPPVEASQDDEKTTTVVLAQVRGELELLLLDIYHGWIKELKKRLGNMVVPAVIENQSLPGYICKQSGGMWGKWATRSTGTQFTIDQLLNFLSKLSKTMRCYYMEDSMARQILTELLRFIGISSFNHLLMRKNFCTWKRGVQIQYNVSRLEEWCTGHGIAEATLHLQQLLQAAKLLTLNKTSPSDIETIFDVCFLLNASQIKKVLSLYYAADFDSPLSAELLKIVVARAAANEKTDILLLDLDAEPEFAKPNPRNVKNIERFIPNWISLPYIQAVLSAGLPSSPAK